MTTFLLGLLFVALAMTCEYAGEKGVGFVATPAKIGALLALLALALALGVRAHPGGTAFLVGLVLCLVGDAALTRHGEPAFLVGLGAFLLAHVAYIVAFAAGWFSLPWLLVALILVLPFALLSSPRVRRGAARTAGPTVGWCVTGYVAVVLAMALAAGATGRPLLALGGVLFVVSDTVLGLDRFDRPRAHAPLVVLGLYHLAQLCLVLGMTVFAPALAA